MTYFSSTWIANLGVVPLFWFAAFLLLPILVFLLFLLLRVTRVLETISHSLTYLSYGRKNLTSFSKYVKILILIASTCSTQSVITKEIKVLGKGEVVEITRSFLSKYNIGNNKVIKVKVLAPGKLLVKGNQLGKSELLLWSKANNGPTRTTYHVISKAEKTTFDQISRIAEKANLKLSYSSTEYSLSGEIRQLYHYKLIVQLLKDNQVINHQNLSMGPQLKKELLIELYDRSHNGQTDPLDCHFKRIKMICQYDEGYQIPEGIISELQQNFILKLIPINLHRNRMFRAKLNIVKFESEHGRDFHLGLNQLEGNLLGLFNEGITSLIQNNQIKINEKDITVSTIAKPETIIRFDHPANIKIGAELPYISQGNQGAVNTEWKFAGLEVNLTLKPTGDMININYQTMFTRPTDNNSISGSRESSSGFVLPGKPLKLFDITYQNTGLEHSKLPYLSSIPLLGALFTNQSDQTRYKKVTAFLLLEEIQL